MPPRARVSRSRLTAAGAEEPPAVPAPAPAKKATRSRALSVDTLEQLGARQLAELLMAQAKGDPALARSLRLVLAGTDGSTRLAAEVEKRLRTIQRSRGFIEWDKVRPLARELEGLRETIAGPLAAADPRAAAAQMRLFLDLAEGVFERSDDGSGSLGNVFREAGADLGRLWALPPGRDPVALAAELLALLDADGYGTTDRLLAASGPALGPNGRAELRRLLQARLVSLPRGRGRDDFEPRGRFMVSLRLRELSDLEGDVDAYIAAVEAGGRAENVAGDIAERLIAHHRPAEALAWLDRASGRHEEERQIDLRIAALDALEPQGGGAGPAVDDVPALPQRRAPAGSPARAAGFRRRRGGGAGDRARSDASRPGPSAHVPGDVAEPEGGEPAGAGPSRRARWRAVLPAAAGR